MDEPTALSRRDRALEELASRRFDLLVIGGGIIGAGIANEATRAGLAVALVDRRDFGSQTSSASSKLIHGGLRYLRLGDVRLVREAHRERRALLRVVAPHLVRRLPFLLPLYQDGPYRLPTVQLGLWLYSTLARERLGGVVAPARARRSVPGLRVDGLRGCGLYTDAWTHDGRLCLANVRAAADRGATVLNYAAVDALRVTGGRLVGAEIAGMAVSARAVVNAAGPWVDAVRRLEDPRAAASVRMSKGAHLLLELDEAWSAGLTIPQDEVRVSFALPWEGMLLLGTTDELYEGDPGAVTVTEEDAGRILAEAAVALEPAFLEPERVRARFAGVRVLPGTGRATTSARRETVLLRGPGGMVSVAGGKLTTYRRIALSALRELDVRGLDTTPLPLPGATDLVAATARLARRFPQLEPSVRSHLLHLYGSLAEEVLAPAEDDPALLELLVAGAPDVAAQALYARTHEWARTVEDIAQRRTTIGLRGLTLPESDKLIA
jgi:glycerol-3-phosphate dehydrogenase